MFLFLISAENLKMLRKMKSLVLYKTALFYPQILPFKISENHYFRLKYIEHGHLHNYVHLHDQSPAMTY